MPLKHRVHGFYKKVKHSRKWHTNRLLILLHPLFDLVAVTLIFGYQKIYLSLKRSRPGKSARTTLAFIRNRVFSLELVTIYFDFARFFAKLKLWQKSRRFYQLGLDRELKKTESILIIKPVRLKEQGLIKKRLHETYKEIKYSDKWQSSWKFTLFRPLFIAATYLLIFGYREFYLPIRRSWVGVKYRKWRISARKRKYKKLLRKARSRKRSSPRLQYINEAKFNISVIERLLEIDKYKHEIRKYRTNNKNVRTVVYTAIAGGYDSLKLPTNLLPDVDYVVFTDQTISDSGIFKIRPLPYFHVDTPRMTRYVKTHPHQLLEGYDLAIWIDANILINGDISRMIKSFKKSGNSVGAIQHPLRDTLEQEAAACIAYSKDDERAIREQIAHYKELNYETNSLIESNIMMFDLTGKKLSDFFSTWWSEIDKYTRRDQLSLNYSLDKHSIAWHYIMERPNDARNHSLFTLVPHLTRQNAVLTLEKSISNGLVDPYSGSPFAKDKIVRNHKNRKVDIVYCVHNAHDDVKLCLESVAKHRNNPNLNLIIVDDGSDKTTADFLRHFQKKYGGWTKLLRNESATGYTKAANKGMRASNADLVIILNSDTIVTDGWTEKMAEAVFSTPGAGIVGPLSSAASHQSIPNHIGGATQTATNQLPVGLTPDDINKHCEDWSITGFYPYVPLIHGFCIGITRQVFEKVGYFDEKSFPTGYGEENDLCFRAVDAGFVLVVATNTYIFHAKSKSFQDDKRIKLMKDGNEKLRELRGKERITRAVRSVLANTYLQKFRDNAFALYSNFDK